MITLDPWFADWNHALLEALFRFLPHNQTIDDRFGDLITTPILGTWIFAFFFYRYWAIDDAQQERRRSSLFNTVVAIGVAFLVTGVLRPLVSWPAPVLNPRFQTLFPQYLWGQGNWNCFPSHSTLAYFTVTAGFWQLNRRLSICLSMLVLLCVSLPRVYLGGHYPIDVFFSLALSVCTLFVLARWQTPAVVSQWLIRRGYGTRIRDGLLFLWIFELGEGFRGAEFAVATVRRLFRGP